MTSWWDSFRADCHDPGRPDRPLNLNECALSRLNWKSHVQGTVLTEGSGAARHELASFPQGVTHLATGHRLDHLLSFTDWYK